MKRNRTSIENLENILLKPRGEYSIAFLIQAYLSKVCNYVAFEQEIYEVKLRCDTMDRFQQFISHFNEVLSLLSNKKPEIIKSILPNNGDICEGIRFLMT